MPTLTPQDHEALLAMLDNVFFLEDDPADRREFITLLPKLYKKEYRPWDNNYCAVEDGAIKGAVGMYVSELEIAGVPLKLGGIGNVAVARDSRRLGHMKTCMDEAMAAMKAAGCALGELGGQRQRYQFWGFERCGAVAEASFSAKNLRHAFGENEIAPGWRAAKIEPEDHNALARVQVLIESQPIHVRHDPAAFYDILCSWREVPWAVWEGHELRAVFTLGHDGRGVGQFLLGEAGSLEMSLRCVFSALPEDVYKSVKLAVPLWQRELLALAEEISEGVDPDDTGMYTILDWERALGALLALQGRCKPLPDGELTVQIDGFCGAETLRLSVANGIPCVEPFSGSPALTLSHLEALRFFLAPVSIRRSENALAQAWFPLPLWLPGLDKV